jgi:hypothetical protein
MFTALPAVAVLPAGGEVEITVPGVWLETVSATVPTEQLAARIAAYAAA